MSVQDDARENTMILLFNLEQEKDRKRHEPDAFLVYCKRKFLFELKSTTTGSLSTVRDFGRDHIKKWSELHWIVGFFKGGALKPDYCQYLTPDDMKEWTDSMWAYVEIDYAFADIAAARISASDLEQFVGIKNRYTLADAQRVQKKQYTSEQYRARMDLPGGISEQKFQKIVAPFITAEWVQMTVGRKDLYSSTDLELLTNEQADPAKIASAINPDSLVTAENCGHVLPQVVLDDWVSDLKQGAWKPKGTAARLRRLASKRSFKNIADVEPGYSPEAMVEILRDRCRYLIERGSTLNNPHIPPEFFQKFDKITDEHASVLRKQLADYVAAKGLDSVEGAQNVESATDP